MSHTIWHIHRGDADTYTEMFRTCLPRESEELINGLMGRSHGCVIDRDHSTSWTMDMAFILPQGPCFKSLNVGAGRCLRSSSPISWYCRQGKWSHTGELSCLRLRNFAQLCSHGSSLCSYAQRYKWSWGWPVQQGKLCMVLKHAWGLIMHGKMEQMNKSIFIPGKWC